MEHYLGIFVRAVFIENMALTFFLGMCTFIAISKKISTAIGLGVAVVVVLAITVPVNNLIFNTLSTRGRIGLGWLPRSRSELLGIVVLHRCDRRHGADLRNGSRPLRACAVQRAGCVFATDHRELRHFGRIIDVIDQDQTFTESVVFGLGAGVGWALAITALAGVREKLKYSDVPEGLRGLGITFISVGLISLCFMSFGGDI